MSGDLIDVYRQWIIGADRHPLARKRNRTNWRKESKWERAFFVAWDSEGWEVNGEHMVCMVGNSMGDILFDPEGLETIECLDFICAGIARAPSATHVIFAGDYDVNMWLGDMPHRKLTRLWDGQWVMWEPRKGITPYKINYRPRKSFTVRRGQWGGTIWDVFGFAQSSFVKMLESYKLAPKAEIERMERMKEQREHFAKLIAKGEYNTIAHYMRDELDNLVKFAEAINTDAKAVNLQLSRYDGAGAAAAALLKRENVKAYLSELPKPVEEASRYGYFGGRIELIRFGRHLGKVWKYDINSAYPSVMATLPCLACGHWVESKTFPPKKSSFAIWRVKWSGSSPCLLGPLPWRDKRGNVFFPYWGEGWYWTPELITAHAMGYFQITPVQGYEWVSDCDHSPMGFVPELYEYRRQLKEKGGAGEKMLKLALNSLYGKFAQTAGGEKRIPPYHNLAYAGYITSATRAKLYSAALLAGKGLVALATDAVFSTRKLPIDSSVQLGQWSLDTYDSITTVQSGVYWLGSKAFNPSASRGFGRKNLTLDQVLTAWKARAPYVRINQRAFIGMGLAANIGWEHWRTWRDMPRDIDIWQSNTKRVMDSALLYRSEPWQELIPTQPAMPHTLGIPRISSPVKRPWDSDGTVLAAERQQDPRMEEALAHAL